MKHWVYKNAYFTNANEDTIQITWLDGDKEIEENILNDTSHHRYQELLNHTSLDDIYNNTVEERKIQRKAFKQAVIQIAKEDGLIYTENNSTLATELLNALTRDADQIDKKELFQFKLVVFESSIVADSKKSKTKLRQAKTYKEAILELIKFIE